MAGRATRLAPASDRRVAGAAAAGRDTATSDRDTAAPDHDAGAVRSRRSWLTWRRLPVLLELATLGAAYGAPSLVRIVLTTTRATAFGHAAALYRVETELGLNMEPWLNHLVAPHAVAALTVGYYYALLHFILTPLALAWLYVFRPRAFPRLRSALVLSTIGANIVFWTWPVAPPRFAVPGLTDVLTSHNVLDAGDPHGVTGAANLYAALPSLHVCWAAWCALAVVTATRSRWRHLAWLYPAATTFVVLATANHFVFDVAGGLAITGLGLAATRLRPVRLRSVHLPRLATVGTAVLNTASLSGAAFGALVGVPIPAAAVVSAARLTAAHPATEPWPDLGEARGQVAGHGVHAAGQGPS
jgi:hypothetical protein